VDIEPGVKEFRMDAGMDRLLQYGTPETIILKDQIFREISSILAARYQFVRKHPAAGLMIRPERIKISFIAAYYADLSTGIVGKLFHRKDTAYGTDLVYKSLKIHFCPSPLHIMIMILPYDKRS
jgi:hypothetical protein